MRLQFIAAEVWQGLRRNATMALAVVIVTFVSLAFLGSAVLLQMQVTNLKNDWYNKVEVSVFLCPDASAVANCASGPVTEAQENAIERILTTGAVGGIVKPPIYYESKEEAYRNLVARDKDGYFSQHLTADDMQPILRVKLKDPEQFQVVADATENLDGVESVVDQRDIFKTLFQVLNRATLIAAALAGVMLLAAVMLITTTIRLSRAEQKAGDYDHAHGGVVQDPYPVALHAGGCDRRDLGRRAGDRGAVAHGAISRRGLALDPVQLD